MNEILISGYYGFKNSGDDALLQSIISDIRATHPNKKIVVLSKNPDETKKIYNVDAINRTNPASIFYHMIKAKLLISGGGTLIQDATSTKSLLYYLGIITLAKLLKTKVMLFANGIGPVSQSKNKIRTTKVLNKADYITLRDEKSFEVLKDLNITKPKIKITADPVFLIKSSDLSSGQKILKDAGVPENKKILGVCIRFWKKSDPDFLEKISDAINIICKKHDLFPVLLPLQPKDIKICEDAAKNINSDCVVLKDRLSVSDTLAVIGNFHIAIGMRLHMLIYAASQAIPIIGIDYDPKINAFLEYAGQDKFVYAQKLDKDRLIKSSDIILENYDEIKQTLIKTSEQMRKKAKENSKIVSLLLEEGN